MDTLITWAPFGFEVDIDGGVSARLHGPDIAIIRLAVDLYRPTPWHAKGKAKESTESDQTGSEFDRRVGAREAGSREGEPWAPQSPLVTAANQFEAGAA